MNQNFDKCMEMLLHSGSGRSIRDRLRIVGCPAQMIDQIVGWATSGVGQKYGEGFTLKIVQRFIKQIE